MKNLVIIFLFLMVASLASGQNTTTMTEGTVSYLTSQHVYVKFSSTKNMAIGDTLFIAQGDKTIPVLVIKNLSSLSCVCEPLPGIILNVADKVVAKPKPEQTQTSKTEPVASPVILTPIPIVNDTVIPPSQSAVPTLKQEIYGRVSVASYSNFSNVAGNSQRMRYTLALNVKNIGNSKLSAESYINFVHKSDNWSDIQDDIFNGLKIYNLSFTYEFNKHHQAWLGRRINPKVSSVGAIDGLQYEFRRNGFAAGIIAGSRPDYNNYSINTSLAQAGGYLSHEYSAEKGSMQNTLAFFQQNNSGKTDRRFIYFQHTNSLVKNLYFFGSAEFDLYNKVLSGQDSTLRQDNSPSLTNLFISLRYKVIKQLTLSASYSARQNIIYYETYKDIVERLLETEMLQGFIFQANLKPARNLALGLKAGYRIRKDDQRTSDNYYGYVTYNQVPLIKCSATASVTILHTSYINGNIYSASLMRDLIPGKLSGGIGYRLVGYRYITAEDNPVQNMGELNLTWRIMKKLLLSMNYEGTFEQSRTYNRLYFNLTQRF